MQCGSASDGLIPEATGQKQDSLGGAPSPFSSLRANWGAPLSLPLTHVCADTPSYISDALTVSVGFLTTGPHETEDSRRGQTWPEPPI